MGLLVKCQHEKGRGYFILKFTVLDKGKTGQELRVKTRKQGLKRDLGGTLHTGLLLMAFLHSPGAPAREWHCL